MVNRRLPIPGEQPSSVWTPRKTKYYLRRPVFRLHAASYRLLVRAALLSVVLTGALWVWRATATHVTVLVNGQPVEVRTHRSTVAGAVRLAGVLIDETVYVQPPADAPLADGMVITLGSQRRVIVHIDGETRIADTHEVNPEAILAGLGITVNPGDAIRIERAMRPTAAEIAEHPALADAPILPREIRVMRPRQVIVREIDSLTGAETAVSFHTTAPTLGMALTEAGYALYEADRILPALSTPIEQAAEVRIERAAPVTVIADGRTAALRTHQRTVAGLLEEVGLALGGGDYAIPAPGTAITAGGTVRVVRVRTEDIDEEIPLPFETIYIPDPDIVLDQQRVIEEGEPGALIRQTRVRYEDGVEVSRALVAEWTAEPPRPQVIGYGTQIVIRTVDTPNGPLEYWRKLTVLATSYSPSTAGHKQPGDPFFGLSATGAEVVRGIVATDPRVIPLGINLYVPGYGPGRALDVGGAVKGFRIDLGYDDQHLVLWNTWVDVYLLTPVPPPGEMVWVLPED